MKRIKRFEELIARRQRNLVNKILCRRDGAAVERSDSACERIDETVQFRVREGTIDVPVAFGCVPVEIIWVWLLWNDGPGDGV